MRITHWTQKPNLKHGWKFWKAHNWKETETGKKAKTYFFIFIGVTVYL